MKVVIDNSEDELEAGILVNKEDDILMVLSNDISID